jgi:hypothetical protein
VNYNFENAGSQYIHKINDDSFEDIALSLFNYQVKNCPVYKQFVQALGINPAEVKSITNIPFLPVSFFKTHVVTSKEPALAKMVFESSQTSSDTPSRHYIFDQSIYDASIMAGFRKFYGEPEHYAIIALLPSYLERKNASLVYMADLLMKESSHPLNGFYLDEWEKLSTTLSRLEKDNQPTLLIGVTFALLDFAASFPMKLKNTIIMETGGMKGRKEELTRNEVHKELKSAFGLLSIHSEYGMTELLSQCYSNGEGIFRCSDSIKVFVRDLNDPFQVMKNGSGLINIIDLANVESCAFIATDDIGNIHQDGSFEVLGRVDHSALRGCSLMTA